MSGPTVLAERLLASPSVSPTRESLLCGSVVTNALSPATPPAAQKDPAPAKTPAKRRRPNISASACRGVVAQLHNLQEIPECLRESSRRGRLEDPEEAAAALEEALSAVDDSLQLAIHAAYDALDGVNAEKAVHSRALADAEAQLASQKQMIIDRKTALADVAKVIKPKADAAAEADVAMKEADTEFKAAACKRRRLETAATDAYAPLKDAPAQGPEGRKMLQILKKVGNEYGFHSELMSVLPTIARKQLDKRRTFDGVALNMLGTEFQRQANALKNITTEAERSVVERVKLAQDARDAWAAAKEHQLKAIQEISEAESAMPKLKDAVAAARRRSRAQAAQSGVSRVQAAKRLAKAKARYEKFRRGPLAAFERSIQRHTAELATSTQGFASDARDADERVLAAPLIMNPCSHGESVLASSRKIG